MFCIWSKELSFSANGTLPWTVWCLFQYSWINFLLFSWIRFCQLQRKYKAQQFSVSRDMQRKNPWIKYHTSSYIKWNEWNQHACVFVHWPTALIQERHTQTGPDFCSSVMCWEAWTGSRRDFKCCLFCIKCINSSNLAFSLLQTPLGASAKPSELCTFK